eukprot:gene5751-9572_t
MSTRGDIVQDLLKGKKINKEQLKSIFDYYDTNEDNVLDSNELSKLVRDVLVYSIVSDPDSDTTAELSKIHSPEGIKMIQKCVNDLIELKDTNHDGVIQWEEFSSHILGDEEKETTFRHRYWRLAPLMDVKVENLLDEEKKDPYFRFKLFVAGAVATSFARCLGAPLTRITILQQTHEFRSREAPGKVKISNIQIVKDIFKNEGLRGFWRGNLTDLTRSIPQGGITYLVYEIFKKYFLKFDSSTHGTYSRLLAGGSAGLVNVLSTYPLEVVRTRLAVQSKDSIQYNGIVDTIKKIRQQEGFKAFYRGCGISMTQSFPMMAMNYTLFDYAKGYLEDRGYKGMVYSVLSGVFSGTITSSVLFPMDVVIRNMQLDGDGKVFKSPMDCARKIFVNQGVKGFFRGYAPMLLKAVPIVSANLE